MNCFLLLCNIITCSQKIYLLVYLYCLEDVINIFSFIFPLNYLQCLLFHLMFCTLFFYAFNLAPM